MIKLATVTLTSDTGEIVGSSNFYYSDDATKDDWNRNCGCAVRALVAEMTDGKVVLSPGFARVN